MWPAAKSFIYKFRSWIVLAVIIVFNAAAFFASIELLEKENHALLHYKQEIQKKDHLDELFLDLQTDILLYFDRDQPGQEEVNSIAWAFEDFQNSFLNFQNLKHEHNFGLLNPEHEHKLFSLQPEEIKILNDIQECLFKIVPYIQEAAEGGENKLQEEVIVYIEDIERNLQKFGDLQTSAEEEYLSKDSIEDRKNRILFSISVMGLSSLFLILFLIYKNQQLEQTNVEKQKMFDVADRRIQAIEASNDGIAIMGPDQKLLYMNKALADLHGIKETERDSYIGKSWKELYNDKGKAYIEGHVNPFLYNLGEWRGESRIKRKDGEIIEAELSLTVLPDNAGMIGTARDITHRRQAETENKELQSQIHQAQKMEAVGRLAGGVAHDFNNVLAAIMGYAEFLSEDLEKDKKLKQFADNILMAGQKGRGLIDQMLTFSRRKESHMSVVDLRAAIEETISMISAGLPKSIDLNINFHHDKPAYINGDTSQISQALMNIVVNAVDAMENDKGELSISLFQIEPDDDMFEGMIHYDFLPKNEMPPIHIQSVDGGNTILEMGKLKRGQDYFQISISDTGTGISDAVMQHLFEPFFTTKPVDKGTGLGMANVHGAVVAHQGAMIIDSVLTEGSTFDLFFPQAEYIDDLSLLGNEPKKKHDDVDFKGIRALIVDDQPDVLSMMETLLKRSGFECVPIPSAMEALEYIRQDKDKFDIVITDQNMPKMTGIELVEQCAQIHPTLPFIIISGYSHEKLQEIRMNYPTIKATIRKPAKKEVLLKAIRDVLKGTI